MGNKRRTGPTPQREWGPWIYTSQVVGPDVAGGRSVKDLPDDEEVATNNVFTVLVKRLGEIESDTRLVWLSIRRNDRKPCRDWRHLQRIKNELVGEECEAVELFPAESRLVDEANSTHLWCVDSEEFRWPFGYTNRSVLDHDADAEAEFGHRQRPFGAEL